MYIFWTCHNAGDTAASPRGGAWEAKPLGVWAFLGVERTAVGFRIGVFFQRSWWVCWFGRECGLVHLRWLEANLAVWNGEGAARGMGQNRAADLCRQMVSEEDNVEGRRHNHSPQRVVS